MNKWRRKTKLHISQFTEIWVNFCTWTLDILLSGTFYMNTHTHTHTREHTTHIHTFFMVINIIKGKRLINKTKSISDNWCYTLFQITNHIFFPGHTPACFLTEPHSCLLWEVFCILKLSCLLSFCLLISLDWQGPWSPREHWWALCRVGTMVTHGVTF